VSQRESFIRFCVGGTAPLEAVEARRFDAIEGVGDLAGEVGCDDVLVFAEGVRDWLGLLTESERDAGGPTGTMREPNSTPIVTS
jgi:hypothetical protein